MKEYRVQATGPQVDWRRAVILEDFSYPWRQEKPPRTTFRALWDEVDLYFRFDVEDPDIRIFTGDDPKMDIVRSDRVEIFFRRDEGMTPYYGLEMDPLGRVLDYRADYHRQFDYGWSWPAGLDVRADKIQRGYTVSGQISLESLRELGLLHDDYRLEAGLFRANCVRLEEDQADFKWISWMDPGTVEPDFHVPAAFGVLRFEK